MSVAVKSKEKGYPNMVARTIAVEKCLLAINLLLILYMALVVLALVSVLVLLPINVCLTSIILTVIIFEIPLALSFGITFVLMSKEARNRKEKILYLAVPIIIIAWMVFIDILRLINCS